MRRMSRWQIGCLAGSGFGLLLLLVDPAGASIRWFGGEFGTVVGHILGPSWWSQYL
jgi:hypothetical protein